ncbi:MAG: CHASE3 domain-containing protein, partial [Candidatus Tectomicrobia bacterium]|nr:CHASE3 domain-containing protein [Candidatus Tectomicrobia bacterium]
MAPKLTIAKKMLLGYLSMALLTIAVGAYALYNLHQQNQITRSMVSDSFPVLDHSKDLVNILLAQERSEKRFLVSGDPDFVALFQARGQEFRRLLAHLQQQVPRAKRKRLKRIGALHADYEAHFLREVPQVLREGTMDPFLLSQDEGTRRLNQV